MNIVENNSESTIRLEGVRTSWLASAQRPITWFKFLVFDYKSGRANNLRELYFLFNLSALAKLVEYEF